MRFIQVVQTTARKTCVTCAPETVVRPFRAVSPLILNQETKEEARGHSRRWCRVGSMDGRPAIQRTPKRWDAPGARSPQVESPRPSTNDQDLVIRRLVRALQSSDDVTQQLIGTVRTQGSQIRDLQLQMAVSQREMRTVVEASERANAEAATLREAMQKLEKASDFAGRDSVFQKVLADRRDMQAEVKSLQLSHASLEDQLAELRSNVARNTSSVRLANGKASVRQVSAAPANGKASVRQVSAPPANGDSGVHVAEEDEDEPALANGVNSPVVIDAVKVAFDSHVAAVEATRNSTTTCRKSLVMNMTDMLGIEKSANALAGAIKTTADTVGELTVVEKVDEQEAHEGIPSLAD